MRFAHILTVLIASSLIGAPALAAPLLAAPRVAGYAGYTRLVMDLPAGITYRLEPLGAALRVTLAGIVTTPATMTVRKPELSGYTLANAANSAVLNIVAPQGVGDRSGFKASVLEASPGKTGYRLVLDFSGAFADTTKLVDPTPLRLPFTPAQPLTVLLDAGHGGSDPGALSNGLREDTFNLNMVMRVKAWLERVPGVRVELTRTSNTVFSNDKRTDLSARARMSRGKTLFVSLHANAVPRASWNSQFGAETYYFSPLFTKPVYVPPLPPLKSVGAALSPTPAAVSAPVVAAPAPVPEKPIFNSEPATLISAPDAASFAPAATPDDPQAAPLEPVVNDEEPLPDAQVPPAPLEPPSEDASFDARPEPLESPSVVTSSPAPSSAPTLISPAPTTLVAKPAVAMPVTIPDPIGVSLTLPGLDRIGASRALASSVQSRLIFATRANNRGVRSADFYVIKNAESPAILVEIGFLTHPIEAQMLKNANYLERVSYGVASGVTAYLSNLVAP